MCCQKTLLLFYIHTHPTMPLANTYFTLHFSLITQSTLFCRYIGHSISKLLLKKLYLLLLKSYPHLHRRSFDFDHDTTFLKRIEFLITSTIPQLKQNQIDYAHRVQKKPQKSQVDILDSHQSRCLNLKQNSKIVHSLTFFSLCLSGVSLPYVLN